MIIGFLVGILVVPRGTGWGSAGELTRKAQPSPSRDPFPERLRVINRGREGEPIDVLKFLVPGKTTIVAFTSEFCEPCKKMAARLEELVKKRGDVVVNHVEINRPGVEGIDFESPVAHQYKIRFTPYLKVFDPNGKLLIEGKPALAKVGELVQKGNAGQPTSPVPAVPSSDQGRPVQ